jgi:RimJ/RimL family protein N-acetyltransferase
MCGRIGFHSKPGPEDLRDVAADGMELGYAIGEPFRRRGFAREAALTLMRWAFEDHRQRCFILSIAPDNEASLAMAHSMGLREVGSHIDAEDGLELYFERRLDLRPTSFWDNLCLVIQRQQRSVILSRSVAEAKNLVRCT